VTSAKTIEINAPAKINLYLDILAKRNDGYHELETVFMPVFNVTDTVEVSLLNEGQGVDFKCNNEFLCSIDDNICLRAVDLFSQAIGLSVDCSIKLTKNIPIAAGLGGGSSDAAAVLKGLNELTGSNLSKTQLLDLARELGADVPFFINPQPAFATGIGDVLCPLKSDIPEFQVVIINPRVPVSTRWAFSQLSEEYFSKGISLNKFLEKILSPSFNGWTDCIYNIFDDLIFNKFPLCCLLREHAIRAGADSLHVSGSGSSLFAVCSGQTTADNVRKALLAHFGNAVLCW